jgi:putative transposase
MYLQGVSTRKVAAITEGLSRVRIGKDAVSRVAQRLEEELSAWRGRPLELAYPYLYLDAAYFKVNWGGRVVDLALLVAVGVNEEGYRGHGRSPYILLLVVEPAGGERKEAWRNLLKGLVERGLRGVRLVISDDHPSIRQAVMAELPGASWQRCVVHFMRNVLAHVPQSERGVVAEELQEVFVARRRGTAESLARGFVERYRDRYRRAVEVFAQGLAAFPSGKHGEEALTYLDFPGVHQRHIKSTNVLERLIREVKRRTRVVGVFPGEGSLVNLATVVMLRATED